MLRVTTSRPGPPAASTSTATASRSCASATTSTRSATTCSHADYSLSEGDVWEDEREIECPKHGSTFSLMTGEPQTLPATQPVPVYDVVSRRRRREGRAAVSIARTDRAICTCSVGRRTRSCAASTSRCSSGEVHALDGPERIRASRRSSHALMGRGDYEVTRGLGHDRRRGAARPADVAARAARPLPRDAVPGRGARRAARATSSARRSQPRRRRRRPARRASPRRHARSACATSCSRAA